MDPKQTLIALESALESHDIDTAIELASSLRRWIDRGGFLSAGQEPYRKLIRGHCVKVISELNRELGR